MLGLFSDRTSTTLFEPTSCVSGSPPLPAVCSDLRELTLHTTRLARAQCSSLRVRLLKIGALITLSVRRVHIQTASAFPLQEAYVAALAEIGKLGSA